VTVRIYGTLEQVEEAPAQGRSVAIGVFDGVHRGHQRILGRAVEEAALTGARSAAVTFYPHPEAVLRPGAVPRELTSPERKAELLSILGIDELVTMRFDQEFAQLSPEAFCRLVLSDRLGARVVFVGQNFRFGHRGSGTATDLAAYGKTHGFEVRPVPLVEAEGETISSTRIRQLLRLGRVSEAARLLGRPHRVEGTVATGAGRGRTLEAPTANLTATRHMALPRLGVYATLATVDRARVYESVTSVGTNPTFETSRKVRIETLLLDYSGDMYGSHLAVDFLERIRGQRVFSDSRALAERIRADAVTARAILAHARGATAEQRRAGE
jgi:riboflavin kinase/FMN adenylyltransferase